MNAKLSLQKINSPAVWYGAELQRYPETWTYDLNEGEISELFTQPKVCGQRIPIGKYHQRVLDLLN